MQKNPWTGSLRLDILHVLGPEACICVFSPVAFDSTSASALFLHPPPFLLAPEC